MLEDQSVFSVIDGIQYQKEDHETLSHPAESQVGDASSKVDMPKIDDMINDLKMLIAKQIHKKKNNVIPETPKGLNPNRDSSPFSQAIINKENTIDNSNQSASIDLINLKQPITRDSLVSKVDSIMSSLKELDQLRYVLSSEEDYQMAHDKMASLANSFNRYQIFFEQKLDSIRKQRQQEEDELHEVNILASIDDPH